MEAAGALIQERGEWSKQRQAVIAANPELRERELVKLASLAEALAEALKGRGVKEPSATLTAEAGVAAFKVAFTKWVEQPTKRNLPRLIRQSLDDLRTIAAGRYDEADTAEFSDDDYADRSSRRTDDGVGYKPSMRVTLVKVDRLTARALRARVPIEPYRTLPPTAVGCTRDPFAPWCA